MLEKLLCPPPKPWRRWQMALTLWLVVALYQIFPILAMFWFLAKAVPLQLRTYRLARNEELISVGLGGERLELVSYRLQFRYFLQALGLGLLLSAMKVVATGHGGVLADVKVLGGALALCLCYHPYAYKRPWGKIGLLSLYLPALYAFDLSLVYIYLVPLAAIALAVKAPLRRLPVWPGASEQNPFAYRTLKLLTKPRISHLLAFLWWMGLGFLLLDFAVHDRHRMQDWTSAALMGLSFCYAIFLRSELSAGGFQLACASPASAEVREGLCRLPARLLRNLCWGMAVVLLPLWLISSQHAALLEVDQQLLINLPLGLELTYALLFQLMAVRATGLLAVFCVSCLASVALAWAPAGCILLLYLSYRAVGFIRAKGSQPGLARSVDSAAARTIPHRR
ncbi:MAG: hypothetical protein U0931_14475 [Vulcanimicrobiota bacterium]